MNDLTQDVKYGVSNLIKATGFTFVAIIALALGIGANSAIFSVVNAVLLRPLPFPEPQRLVSVWETNLQRGESRSSCSYPNFADWRDQNHVFEKISAFYQNDFILTGEQEPARLRGATVSTDLFSLLGVQPMLGREFVPEEEQPGNRSRAAILSYDLWRTRFGASPDILNRTITVNGYSYAVAGVMPAGFKFPVQNEPVEIWTTFAADSAGDKPATQQRGAHFINVIARLAQGVSLDQAQAELNTIAARLETQYPDQNSHHGVRLISSLEDLVTDIKPALLMLLFAVGGVLLIACTNVANLLLARATTRHKEIAIRAAIGATRIRIVRQLLTESVILAVAGGVLGLLLAIWGTDLLVTLAKDDIPRSAGIGLDLKVLAFTLIVSLLTGLLFGVVPAFQSARPDLTDALKAGGRGSSDGIRRNRIRSLLVIGEIAVATILLISAGLLIRSLRGLQNVDPGFDPHNVLALNLGLSEVKYSAQQQSAFYHDLIGRIGGISGVKSASAVMPLPLSGDRMRVSFETEGRPVAKADQPSTEVRSVGLNYFTTMRIPVIKGRDFTEQDAKGSRGVIIVNETFAQQFFPGEDAIGRRIKPSIATDESRPIMREIVGIVGSVKHRKLGVPPDPEAYIPHSQLPFDSMTLVVSSYGDPRLLNGAIQDEIKAMDKDLPVYEVKTLENYVASSVAQPRLNAFLLSIFAGLALVLTAIGLYGVMSYSVAQRTHEMGIRMALGARSGDVVKMVLGHGMVLSSVGLVLGLGGAYFATKILASLLYGISANDPPTFAAMAVVLAIVALGACIVPARRATKVDPIIALRYE